MNKLLKTALVAASLGTIISSTAVFAATVNNNASLNLVTSVTLSEATAMDFGTIERSSSGTTTYTLTNAGVASVSGGDGSFISGSTAGELTIGGEDATQVNVSATAGACTGTGIALTSVEGLYNSVTFDSSSASNVNIAAADTTVEIGGVITVTDAATTGAQTCAYTVTVVYN